MSPAGHGRRSGTGSAKATNMMSKLTYGKDQSPMLFVECSWHLKVHSTGHDTDGEVEFDADIVLCSIRVWWARCGVCGCTDSS